jgi:hydroxyacylglutathione hydrolase
MLNAHPVQAFSDNYIWVLSTAGCSRAVVVDPGDAAPAVAHLQRSGLRAAAVLLTHHHHDHVGGAREVAEHFGCPVYGPADEPIPVVDQPVGDGERFTVDGFEATFEVLSVPGHTVGHIAYLSGDTLLCGDTLFAAGCGRVFEGTPEQMYRSLCRLAALPPSCSVFCAHEYTLSNLRFALAVESGNSDLHARRASCERSRAEGRPTVPSTIADELATNPFVRCTVPGVVEAASRHAGRSLEPGAEVFREIRSWKDSF